MANHEQGKRPEMKEGSKPRDFLSRRPVLATILIQTDADERSVARRLPENYVFENGIFRFPAGYWESYFVNGKEYNVEGDRTIAQQRELIAKDLAEEGFTQDEITEFIEEIPTKEGRPSLLQMETNRKWLKYHPEFEQDAMRLLVKTKNEVNNELRRGMKKK